MKHAQSRVALTLALVVLLSAFSVGLAGLWAERGQQPLRENEMGNLSAQPDDAEGQHGRGASAATGDSFQNSSWRASGYASASSVAQGGVIDFHVSTNAPSYDIRITRLSAAGYELVRTVTGLTGASYACNPAGVPAGQENVALGCNWPVAYTLAVPENWRSGFYAAQLLTSGESPGDWGRYILFVVREGQPGSTSNIVLMYPTFTMQAYNYWGDWSFYTSPPARRITHNRPYPVCSPLDSTCSDDYTTYLTRWLESDGYTFEYITNEDLHADPNLLFRYRLLISAGHDEYWTKELRDNIDAFIDAGGNVAFFTGNTGYRQVRYDPQSRTLVCYKTDWELDPLYRVDNRRVATEFERQPVPNWPENPTTGVRWSNAGYINVAAGAPAQYTVYRSSHWVFAGTGLRDGDQFPYEVLERPEVDGARFVWQAGLPVVTGADQTPESFLILGIQPATFGHATLGIFSRPGGGTVFNAATTSWGRGLWPNLNPNGYRVVRQITRNVIDQLRTGTLPPQPVENVTLNTPATPIYVNQPASFTALISPVSATYPITYTWQFGDGTPEVITRSLRIEHVFLSAGTFTITVTAANNYGQSTAHRSVLITQPPTSTPIPTVTPTPAVQRVFLPLIKRDD